MSFAYAFGQVLSWLSLLQAELAAKPFEYLGVLCGMGGAFFVSSYSKKAVFGWALWIASNAFWLVAGFSTGATPIIIQNIYFFGCNLHGLRQVRKALRQAS